MSDIIVLKFGGSFLRGHADLVRAVHAIYREVREGRRVVAVTSAFYGRTDELSATLDRLEAETTGTAGDPLAARRKRAALLGTGETETAALLASTLERSGVPARLADVRRVGPFVDAAAPLIDGDGQDPKRIDADALRAFLEEAPVVCLPGFIATEEGEAQHPALLGRGGSDLTAVFVADVLDAPVVLVKDVDGLYTADPAARDGADTEPPRRLSRVSYRDAKKLDESVLQPRALSYAESSGQEIQVVGAGALAGRRGTIVGALPTSARTAPAAPRPVRVALLGLGTVGKRVFAELSASPDLFHVTSILVRRGAGVERPRAALPLLVDSIDDLFRTEPDLVIEATGGLQPAASWIQDALEQGIDVVTANKVAAAGARPTLETVARRSGARVFTSAAVGGSVPVLEQVSRFAARSLDSASLTGVTGVLNGTCNAVLESLRTGSTWAEAIEAAQAKGLAEADPTSDLDGSDIAAKLTLIARAAGWLTDANPELRWLHRDCLADGVSANALAEARRSNRRLRLIGSIHPTEVGPVASIVLAAISKSDPLFELEGAANAVLLEHAGERTTVLRGLGAGAWPTATSVMGDVYAAVRRRRLTGDSAPAAELQNDLDDERSEPIEEGGHS
ncbi:MAG: hypothetical protein AAGG01_03805 [Planctomycetota bacterium]